ncbi:uncharacterized protein VTP21DRAFT_5998 [Calcarisporiella thermophila]|uniref:uncharacterized protein n=1 Tax=Calcarisporiella thermophila TaxID=911321 RepID=UPI003744867E
MCPQVVPVPFLMDEDCLTVNVWTPNMNPDKPLPVMLWIFGGTYEFGGASTYDGGDFLKAAENSVVVVSINFRLNIFGFFSTEAGMKEGAANLQLLDQRLAFEWVQKYIRLFGGNPEDVTLWGVSSGAGAIGLHLLHYHNSTARPFHKAILQSAGPTTMIGDVKYYQVALDKIVHRLGCVSRESSKVIECMQKVSWPYLLSTYKLIRGPVELFINLVPTSPVVDGKVIAKDPGDMLREGSISPIPILSGVTTDEATSFMTFVYNPFGDWTQILRGLIPGIQDKDVRQLGLIYREKDYTSSYARAVDVIGDVLFKCPEYLLAKHAKNKRYRYRFNQKTILMKLGPRPFNAGHAFENSYLWPGSISQTPYTIVFSKSDLKLSKEMVNYWVCFAINGDPNCKNQLQWPEYASSDQRIVLQEPGLMLEPDPYDIMDERCTFLDSLRSRY